MKTIYVAAALLFAVSIQAQQTLKEKEQEASFDPAYTSYSRKQTAYLTLKGGEEQEGLVKGLKRKKGQITDVEWEPTGGKEIDVPASQVASLYMAPSGIDKLQKQSDFLSDMTKWGNSNASEYLNKGYSLYRNEMVSLKNKKKPMEMLMQVVNPRFDHVIRVYADPFAKETTSLGVGSLKMVGGIAKSYYLKKGDKVVWLTKSNFEDYFDGLFMDNAKFKAVYADQQIKWSLLGVYILDYTRFSKTAE